MTLSRLGVILDTVKSDGVRPKFSTARGGAAFLRKFATSSRAFCFALPFEVESNPGRSRFESVQMPTETVEKKKRSVEPRSLSLQDYRMLFCSLRYACETAFKIMETRSNKKDQIELIRTLERMTREKFDAFDAKRRLLEGDEAKD